MREKEIEERGGEKEEEEEEEGDESARIAGRRSTERASEENLERKEDDDEEEELNNNDNNDDDDAKNHVTLAMSSSPIKIKRRFTQESLDEDWNDSSGDSFDGTSSGSSIAEKRSAECCEQRGGGGGGGGEGEEEGEEIFYRSFTRLQKKDLEKERSAMNDLKFISRVGLDDGEENDDWETTITTTTTTMKKKNLLEARSRSEKLDAVLLLDVDKNETAEGAEEGEEEGKKKEKKKSRSLRGLVEMMVEKAKMHFDRNDSEAMVSSIFLDDAMNLSVANASVQSNGVLIIPVSEKSVVLK